MRITVDLIIFLFVICLFFICGLRFLTTGLKLSTDIEALVPSLPRIQEKDTVRFLIEDPERRSKLRERLTGLVSFSTNDVAAFEDFCQKFFPYHANFIDGVGEEALKCRPVDTCLREHLSRRLAAESFVGSHLLCDPLLLSTKSTSSLVAAFYDPTILVGKVKKGVRADAIERAVKSFQVDFPDSQVDWSGLLRFSDSSRRRFEKEFNFIATASSIGIVTSLIVTFRSVPCVLIAFGSSLFGFVSGVLACFALGGTIHGLTLSLAGSVLGACVDYSIHWFSECCLRDQPEVKKVWLGASPVIRLGMYTSIIALLPFFFTDSLLLHEFLYFCTGALSGSYCFLSFVSPFSASNVEKRPYLMAVEACNFALKVARSPLFLSCALGIAVFGLATLEVNDDISLLQKPLPHLVASEQRISKGSIPNAHIVIAQGDEVSMSRRFLQVIERVRSSPTLDFPIALDLPALSEQERLRHLYAEYLERHKDQVDRVAKEFGISLARIGGLEPLDLELFRMLSPQLFSAEGDIIIPVVGKPSDSMSFSEGIQLVDYRATVTALFARYRTQSLFALSVGYLLVGILFVFRERGVRGLLFLVPCLATGLITISVVGVCGVPVNFFTTMALALVLGLTADYAVFFLESEGLESAALSVVLSTATTLVAFVPLLFSDTQLLFSVGLTLVVGVLTASLVSPTVVFLRTPREGDYSVLAR